jgi:hypothetical protein
MAIADIMARRKEVILSERTGCFLCANRNDIWCQALNMNPRPELFLWLDADVIPTEGFIDVLEAELRATGADMMSGVVAMKKPGGETSLALDGDLNHKTRRLLLSEVLGRGGTWTDPRVLVATGLVLVDFTKPWVEKVSYSTEDAIVKVGDRFVTVNDSEDYRWCRQVRALGGSIWVTRKVGTAHVGMREHIIPQAVE